MSTTINIIENGQIQPSSHTCIIIVVEGNIAVGKTTFIENQLYTQYEGRKIIKFVEEIGTWMPYFGPYYKVINSTSRMFTLDEQSKILEFQLIATLTRLKQYAQIDYNSDNVYIFERSIQESLDVFIPTLREYVQDVTMYDTLVELHKQFLQFEPKFDKVVYLSAPIDTLYERYAKRAYEDKMRKDELISKEYLTKLQRHYDVFSQGHTPLQTFKNQTHVVGSIGVGKTTFIKQMEATVKHTQPEPLGFWGMDLLKDHIDNVMNKRCNVKTFMFQLRVILSRLLFRKDNCMYERNLAEEYPVFVEQYKDCFTPNQLYLIKEYYMYLTQYFVTPESTFYYLKTKTLKQQMDQIRKRDRDGEDKYTEEYIGEVNKRYEEFAMTLKGKIYEVYVPQHEGV